MERPRKPRSLHARNREARDSLDKVFNIYDFTTEYAIAAVHATAFGVVRGSVAIAESTKAIVKPVVVYTAESIESRKKHLTNNPAGASTDSLRAVRRRLLRSLKDNHPNAESQMLLIRIRDELISRGDLYPTVTDHESLP